MCYSTVLTLLLAGSTLALPRTTISGAAKVAGNSSSTCNAVNTTSGEYYRYLGRVDRASKRLTWPATGIAFSFTGTSANVPITEISGTNAIAVVVDGFEVSIDNVNGSTISTGTLTDGVHTVEIRKKSEALFGSITVGDPTTSGTFCSMAQPTKRIEIIGDSISVGYGVVGTYPCVNTADLEDATLTYGALTAKNISADYSIVAWSGKGIIRNYVTAGGDDGQPTMPELWTRYEADGSDDSYDFDTPVDIVVVNLGTNDFGFTAYDANGTAFQARPHLNMTEYTNALVSFGKRIQSKYAGVELFVTTSPLIGDYYPPEDPAQKTNQLTAVKAAVSQLGEKTHVVDFPSQDTSGNNIGCDYHPSRLTQEQDAVILTDAVNAVASSRIGLVG